MAYWFMKREGRSRVEATKTTDGEYERRKHKIYQERHEIIEVASIICEHALSQTHNIHIKLIQIKLNKWKWILCKIVPALPWKSFYLKLCERVGKFLLTILRNIFRSSNLRKLSILWLRKIYISVEVAQKYKQLCQICK